MNFSHTKNNKEEVGFEPTKFFNFSDFKSDAIDHSAIPLHTVNYCVQEVDSNH